LWLQRNKKEMTGPHASARYVYWPPALGKVVPSSAKQKAPSKDKTPQTTHITKDAPIECTCAVIPFGEINIPEFDMKKC
jgi:hypothetical protein